MTMKRIVPVLALLALVAAACAGEPGPAAPQTYRVMVDGPSTAGANIQLSAFFPAALRVAAGDSVVFENRSSQAPHTVTFGISADRSNAPALITTKGEFAPAAFGPCYTDVAPGPMLETCPSSPSVQPRAFRGAGYWNSGLMPPPIGSTPAAATRTAVAIDPGTPAGSYRFVCLLHPFMTGTLEVVADGATRPTPAQVGDRSDRSIRQAIAAAATLDAPSPAAGEVAAGWGDRIAAVNRFGPAEISVRAGQAVTWKTMSPYEPHTITFQSPFSSAEDPKALIPLGPKSGSAYAGGVASSGFIGEGPFPTTTFSLVFTKPGTYSYVCILHPGMSGVVRVA
jgi:plastocyanin